MAPVPPISANKLHSLDVSWEHFSDEGSSYRKVCVVPSLVQLDTDSSKISYLGYTENKSSLKRLGNSSKDVILFST